VSLASLTYGLVALALIASAVIDLRASIAARRQARAGAFASDMLIGTGILLVGLLVASVAISTARAAERPVRIPEHSAQYRLQINREAARYFGLDASPARLAAQLHQESGWRADAASPFAQGLAQFTPATAKWLPEVCPGVGEPDPWDPSWSIRAQACYNHWLYRRVKPLPGAHAGELSACSRWAYTLRAYNGGEGWITRERRAAAADGADPNNWLGVEPYRVRALWAWRENTDYPRRILLRLEPAYALAGWSGQAVCP
jgi:hypothetical protein